MIGKFLLLKKLYSSISLIKNHFECSDKSSFYNVNDPKYLRSFLSSCINAQDFFSG